MVSDNEVVTRLRQWVSSGELELMLATCSSEDKQLCLEVIERCGVFTEGEVDEWIETLDDSPDGDESLQLAPARTMLLTASQRDRYAESVERARIRRAKARTREWRAAPSGTPIPEGIPVFWWDSDVK